MPGMHKYVPQKCCFSWTDVGFRVVYGSFGPPESTPHAASRSAQPFQWGSPMCSTHRHTDHATFVEIGPSQSYDMHAMRPKNNRRTNGCCFDSFFITDLKYDCVQRIAIKEARSIRSATPQSTRHKQSNCIDNAVHLSALPLVESP